MRAHVFHGNAYCNSKNYSRNSTHKRYACRLNQKLLAYGIGTCAQCLSYAYLLLAFSNRNNHYVHYSNSANQKRNGCNSGKHHGKRIGYLANLVYHCLHGHNPYRTFRSGKIFAVAFQGSCQVGRLVGRYSLNHYRRGIWIWRNFFCIKASRYVTAGRRRLHARILLGKNSYDFKIKGHFVCNKRYVLANSVSVWKKGRCNFASQYDFLRTHCIVGYVKASALLHF